MCKVFVYTAPEVQNCVNCVHRNDGTYTVSRTQDRNVYCVSAVKVSYTKIFLIFLCVYANTRTQPSMAYMFKLERESTRHHFLFVKKFLEEHPGQTIMASPWDPAYSASTRDRKHAHARGWVFTYRLKKFARWGERLGLPILKVLIRAISKFRKSKYLRRFHQPARRLLDAAALSLYSNLKDRVQALLLRGEDKKRKILWWKVQVFNSNNSH